MVLEFLRWWYGPGWLEAWRNIPGWALQTERAFSVGILLKTLFSPWKQIVALPGRSFDEKIKGLIDNLISRFVGFFTRIITLFSALILMVFAVIFALVLAVVWPVLPLAIFYLIYRSAAG